MATLTISLPDDLTTDDVVILVEPMSIGSSYFPGRYFADHYFAFRYFANTLITTNQDATLDGDQPAATGTLSRAFAGARSLDGNQPAATGTLVYTSSAAITAMTPPRDLCDTMLTLERFARILGYSPMLFYQVYVPDLQPASSCSDPVLQYTWQPRGGGQPGRQEIAEAICQAEDAITRELGFSPIPRWRVDDAVSLSRGWPGRAVTYSSGFQGYFRLSTAGKYVLYGGSEAWSSIDAAAAITYSDIDGDGYAETATVTVATSVTDANEIAVFYPNASHDASWEIRPLRVTIDALAGTATITFGRHLCVLPELIEELDAAAVDGTNDNNFLTTVEVWRRYNDPSQMAIAEWPAGACAEAGVGSLSAQPGVFTVSDSRNGVLSFTPAAWDADTSKYIYAYPTWNVNPDRVRLWYKSGLVNSGGARSHHDMLPQLERAIAYLALSYLDREWQSCEQLHNLHAHWRADMSIRRSSPSESTSYNFNQRVFDNPFGSTRAAIYAWRVVQQLAVGQAVLGS